MLKLLVFVEGLESAAVSKGNGKIDCQKKWCHMSF